MCSGEVRGRWRPTKGRVYGGLILSWLCSVLHRWGPSSNDTVVPIKRNGGSEGSRGRLEGGAQLSVLLVRIRAEEWLRILMAGI